jgi:preprotein translocase subunit SecF
MEFFHKTNFDFMAWRRVAISLSVTAILIGIVSMFLKGGPAYNIDFLGGSELQVRFQQPKTPEALRGAVAATDFRDVEIKQFGDPHHYVIRFQQQPDSQPGSEQVMTALKSAFPDNPPELLALSTIGPKVGHELQESAVWAVLFSLGLILIYISIRFEFIFAVGAVIALFHDVLITLGIFSILNREIGLTVLGAFLTLVGYSLNDTIVVFDRIRENLKVRRREAQTINQIINLSINDTLSRTILTGTTTLMVIVVSLAFGGEALRDFFLCLFIGIIVGTYSSVFIAAPVISGWYSKGRSVKPGPKTATVR